MTEEEVAEAQELVRRYVEYSKAPVHPVTGIMLIILKLARYADYLEQQQLPPQPRSREGWWTRFKNILDPHA